MSFFVDIVTEDSFYENATLGVARILENTPCVRNVLVDRRQGCDSNSLSNWEQKHCCVLPEDLRNFYTSIDGFLLTWSFQVSGEEFPIGRMEIGPLSSLKRFPVPAKEGDPGPEEDPESNSPGPNGKVFEFGQTGDGSKRVLLVYRTEEPEIWLFQEKEDDGTIQWHRLSDSFGKYFRMMLVHLGLPQWQVCACGLGLPAWVEQLYRLIGPHLLPDSVKPSETISATLWSNGPTNVLDPGIFKGREGKQKCGGSRKK